MHKILLLIGVGLIVTACSSAPKYAINENNYCSTKQNITVKNGEQVDSITKIECDDSTVKIFAKTTGISDDCTRYRQRYLKNGKTKNAKGIYCKMPGSDSWELIEPPLPH